MSRHAPFLDKLRDVAVDGPGVSDAALRRAAFHGEPLPAGLQTWAEKVRSRAAAIEDADVAALKAAGLSEDAIFELTVCTAAGEAARRLALARKAFGRT